MEIDFHGFLVVDSIYFVDMVEALHPYARVAVQLSSVIKAPGVTSPVPFGLACSSWGKFSLSATLIINC